MLRLIAIIFTFCWQGLAQGDFEAASVKVAAKTALPAMMPAPGTPGMHGGPGRAVMSGGPGTNSPGSIFYRNVTLRDLVLKAYSVAAFQLTAPTWFDAERFEIQAKLPLNTTKSDFETMLQHLLAERFHLAVRREEREMPGYQLVVDAKGIKMKESAGSIPGMHVDFGPGPIVDYRIVGNMQSMAVLADTLEKRLSIPIREMTGLTGLYDFQLEFAVEDAAAAGSGPPPVLELLPAAVRNQLGLRLDRSKVKVPVLVVERAERIPTGN
jgi:uncharacterized protein (TIGR03435 family)